MTRDDLKKHIDDLNVVEKERDLMQNDWLKNIITIASGFLAIIVSLKSEKSETDLQSILFIITILSISIGILSGLLVLFGDIVFLNLIVKKKKEQISKLVSADSLEIDFVEVPKIYKYIGYMCYFSLIVSLFSLTYYAVLFNL